MINSTEGTELNIQLHHILNLKYLNNYRCHVQRFVSSSSLFLLKLNLPFLKSDVKTVKSCYIYSISIIIRQILYFDFFI